MRKYWSSPTSISKGFGSEEQDQEKERKKKEWSGVESKRKQGTGRLLPSCKAKMGYEAKKTPWVNISRKGHARYHQVDAKTRKREKKTSKHEKLIHSGRNGGDGKEDVEEKRSKMLLLRAALVQVYNNTMISSEWVSEWVRATARVCVYV